MLVSAFARSRELDDSALDLHDVLALQAVQALTRMRLQGELERMALYDALTGLASRHHVDRLLADAEGSAAARGLPMAVIFVDLDGFKAVNDSLGHQGGDLVLREIAERLTAAVRAGDLVGRLGGDEFVVICRDLDAENADAVISRLQAALRVPLSGVLAGTRITASIGLALRSGMDSGSVGRLLQEADAAMYASKAAGKDRATIVTVG